jgi:hypothetical protein
VTWWDQGAVQQAELSELIRIRQLLESLIEIQGNILDALLDGNHQRERIFGRGVPIPPGDQTIPLIQPVASRHRVAPPAP